MGCGKDLAEGGRVFVVKEIAKVKQSGRRTDKSTCLLTISRGNFVLCLYCTFRPNKYISVRWTRSDFLWAPANTFLFKDRLQSLLRIRSAHNKCGPHCPNFAFLKTFLN